MECISLSQQDINIAISKIKTASCCMTEDWFKWVEPIVVQAGVNNESFIELKRKCLSKEQLTLKEISYPTTIKKNYHINSSIKLFSQEYVLLGRGKEVKEVHLTLVLPIEKISQVMKVRANNNSAGVYVIACKNRALIKKLKIEDISTVLLMCEMLQLTDDYHVYDCSSYDISELSKDNILSNLHRFRKLI